MRGMSAVRAAKDKMGGGGGGGKRIFTLADGEEALCRFFGDFEGDQDPVVKLDHFVKRLNGREKFNTCSHEFTPEGDETGECVFCYARDVLKDKGIGKSPRAGFFLKDYRFKHYLETPTRVLKPGYKVIPGKQLPATAYEETKYPFCSAPARPCRFCKEGNERKPAGYAPWKLALQYTEQLLDQQYSLRNFCQCGAMTDGGEGTISVANYHCGNPDCGAEVEFYPDEGQAVVQCQTCGEVLPPIEAIVCSACESAARADLQHFIFRVKRTGDGKSTSYNFTPVLPLQLPTDEELEEAEKYKPDWDEEFKVDSLDEQARRLGIPNPFVSHAAPGRPAQPAGPRPAGAVSYGSVPARPAPVAAPKIAVPAPGHAWQPRPPVKAPVAAPKIGAPKPLVKVPTFKRPAPAEEYEQEDDIPVLGDDYWPSKS